MIIEKHKSNHQHIRHQVVVEMYFGRYKDRNMGKLWNKLVLDHFYLT
jgi:hypothetical protein